MTEEQIYHRYRGKKLIILSSAHDDGIIKGIICGYSPSRGLLLIAITDDSGRIGWRSEYSVDFCDDHICTIHNNPQGYWWTHGKLITHIFCFKYGR